MVSYRVTARQVGAAFLLLLLGASAAFLPELVKGASRHSAHSGMGSFFTVLGVSCR